MVYLCGEKKESTMLWNEKSNELLSFIHYFLTISRRFSQVVKGTLLFPIFAVT